MKTKNFASFAEGLAYVIKRLDGTTATFDDQGDDSEGGESVVSGDATPYTFIMGSAPKHFNGEEFAKILLAKYPEIANYELESYGGSDSYFSMSVPTSGNGVMEDVLKFDVSDFVFSLYRHGGTIVSVNLNDQPLPKTIYQFLFDIGEITFPDETFQDKYRNSITINKVEIWLEARYQYFAYFNKSEVEKFLY